MARKSLAVVFAAITILLLDVLLQQPVRAGEAPVPGGACIVEESTYIYVTGITQTPWKLDKLYAVPVGTMNPGTWENSEDFRAQFEARLGASQDPPAYAEACAQVWGSFFSGPAEVLVNVSRTITATRQALTCAAGIWNVSSTDNLEICDSSDWLAASSVPYDVTQPTSQSVLQSDLASLLEYLNAQPGAATHPE